MLLFGFLRGSIFAEKNAQHQSFGLAFKLGIA
jgi:hypothetical protein